MKTSIRLFTVFSVFTILFLAGFSTKQDHVKSVKDDIVQVDPFTSLNIALSAKIFIEQGSPQKLVIDADPETLDRIRAEVHNGKLELGLREPFNRLKGEVTIRITVPGLEGISVAGSARVMSNSTFKADEMTLRISGSGEITFDDLNAKEMDARISGSGNINLTGRSDEFGASVSGSGKIEAFGFEVSEFEGKISGSGKCMVNVTNDLEASIAGSGSIVYKGKPQVSSRVSGSGSVKSYK